MRRFSSNTIENGYGWNAIFFSNTFTSTFNNCTAYAPHTLWHNAVWNIAANFDPFTHIDRNAHRLCYMIYTELSRGWHQCSVKEMKKIDAVAIILGCFIACVASVFGNNVCFKKTCSIATIFTILCYCIWAKIC